MGKMSITQQRFLENAVLIAALQLIFKTLEKSDIPLYSLGEIANTTSGGTPDRGRSEYYGGDIPWIKSGELNDGVIEGSEEYITNIGLSNSSAKIYPEGTLVVALYGATVGKTGILAIDAASNQAVCAVTPINEEINKYFLFWFLRYKRPEFLKNSFGGAQPNISQKILRETALPLPPSKLQKQICAYLEAIETRLKEKNSVIVPDLPAPLSKINSTVQKVEELAAKIEEARGLRKEAVEETDILIDTALDKVFNNLSRKTRSIVFGDVGGFVTSGPRGWGNYYNENGHRRLIRVENVTDNIVDLSIASKVEIPSDEGDIERSQVQINDVLVTITGAIGRVGIVTEFDMPCHVSQHVALMRAPQEIYPHYLYWYLRSPIFGRSQTEGKTYGATKPGINLTNLRTIRIITPSIEEQYDIVAYFNGLQAKIDALKQQQSQTSAELNALLPSILDKAFKGDL